MTRHGPGLIGKPAELVEISPVLEDRIPVIRRFTGGGTVIFDHETIFVTFICNQNDVPKVQPYPRPIMSWSSLLYSKVFEGVADFKLRGNVSMPEYHGFLLADVVLLQARDHLDFICLMKDYISRSDFINKTIDAARSQFYVELTEFEAIKPPSNLKFTPTSKLLTTQELEAAAIYQTPPIEASL
ncbi:hypothetical protein Tco_1473398 [Tanacetum coccineum]